MTRKAAKAMRMPTHQAPTHCGSEGVSNKLKINNHNSHWNAGFLRAFIVITAITLIIVTVSTIVVILSLSSPAQSHPDVSMDK